MARVHIVPPVHIHPVYTAQLTLNGANQDGSTSLLIRSEPIFERSYKGIHVDPIIEYWRWFVGGDSTASWRSSLVLSEKEFDHRFWTMEPVHAFMETLEGHVFIQFAHDEYKWRFFFSDSESLTKFQEWIFKQNLTHSFHFGGRVPQEVEGWMRLHIKGEKRMSERSVSIRDDIEAVHFKMRWSDVLV